MKKFFAAMTAAVMVMGLASTALAAPPTDDLTTQAWRIQYAKPATSSFWDINKVKLDGAGDLSFPVQRFETPTTGSFATYFQNNYNTSLTADQTLTATASWTEGDYETRSGPGGYGRFWFQSAIGNWTANDYWWYSGDRLDLNTGSGGTMTADLSERALWTNICGKPATDTTVYTGDDCVGGTYPAVSPSEGFDNAMANVKQLGISFGSASFYARGVAFVGATGTFTVSDFTVITP